MSVHFLGGRHGWGGAGFNLKAALPKLGLGDKEYALIILYDRAGLY